MNIIVSFNKSNIGVNIPEEGIPMIGKAEIDLSNASVVTIDLQRLLAKVEVNLTVKMEGATFDIESCTIYNIPTKFSLITDSNKPVDLVEKQVLTTVNPSSLSSFTFYVPEYVVHDPQTKQQQTGKPGKVPDGANPLYISIQGIFNHPTLAPAPIKYDIYLGNNNSDDFNIYRNTYYQNNIVISGVDNAIRGTDERVEYSRHNLADPDNDGTEEAANCYIISQPGRYMFPAVKGNQKTQTVTGKDSSYVSDGKNTINIVGRVNQKGQKDNSGKYIAFDYLLNGGKVVDGNSVLTFGDWSWHLWFSTEVPDNQNYPPGESVSNPIIMDRNLGAGPDVGGIPQFGLYYKKGNKNPGFLSETNVTYNGIGNDNTTGWTASKSINDPCPPGYKMPSSGVWFKEINLGTLEKITQRFTNDAFAYNVETANLLDRVMYPYTGYENTNMMCEAYKSTQFTGRSAEIEQSNVTFKLVYDGHDYFKKGKMWAHNGMLSYERFGTEVTSAKVTITAAGQSLGPFLVDPNSSGFASHVSAYMKSKGWSELIQWFVNQALKALNIDSIIMTLFNGLTTIDYVYDSSTGVQSDYGAQVRCQKIVETE